MTDIKDLDSRYIAHTYGRFPVTITEGRGSVAVDDTGRKYIDLGAGIAVNLFGYGDEIWQAAVIEQLRKVQHTSNLYYSEPCVKLAQALCERTGLRKVFYANSGAEANECAVKAARRYGQLYHGDDYYNIITLRNSFHGRTLTALAATGQDCFHELFQPLTPGFYYSEADDLDSIKELTRKYKTAAVMIECVQGEGGVNVLDKDFVKGLRQFTEENDILLITDEVQAGNGRSGKLYSYMNFDIMPDIVTTAKGLGGGLPIGVTMLGEKVEDIFGIGDNGSTFGGNPVVCAGALANLERLTEAFLKDVERKSEFIFGSLTHAEGVAGISGMGLLIGIEPANKQAAAVAQKCLAEGVLVLTAGHNKVRLLPALNIPDELLIKAVEILRRVLAEEE